MLDDDLIPKEFGRTVRPAPKQKGLFALVRNFLPFGRESTQHNLVGRIHAQLQKDAESMLLQLQTLKETLRKELDNHHDSQLWISLEAVLNPLLREYRQIEKQIIQPTDGEEEHHFKIRNVNHWIDRAKVWVILSRRPSDRDTILQAVRAHTMDVLAKMVDRDLKTIVDYQEHELRLLGVGDEILGAVRHRLDEDLAPTIQKLKDLKTEKPEDFALSALVEWKNRACEERTHLFNSALQHIDSVVGTISPSLQEHSQEHLKDVIYRIAYLENEIQVLQVQLENSDLNDALQKEMLWTAHAFFEAEAHQAHHDMRLTPELVERIQILIQQLEELRLKLGYTETT